MIEFRVCWRASSNINFKGESDWERWEQDEDATEEQVERAVSDKSIDGVDGVGVFQVPWGMEMALEFSGFDWWVETRDAS